MTRDELHAFALETMRDPWPASPLRAEESTPRSLSAVVRMCGGPERFGFWITLCDAHGHHAIPLEVDQVEASRGAFVMRGQAVN